MWILGGRANCKEDFWATVTDKQITKQGIWITIRVGLDKAEGELLTAFGLTEEDEQGLS